MNIFVGSNCATFAYARGISQLAFNSKVLCCSVATLTKENVDAVSNQISCSECAVLSQEFINKFESVIGTPFSYSGYLIKVPGFSFTGFHPDCCYLVDDVGNQVVDHLGAYHSMIAFSCYKNSISVADAFSFFSYDTYEKAGYFLEWDKSKNELLSVFEKNNFDFREEFVAWTKRGVFMYTINHPKIEVFNSITEAIVKKIGIKRNDVELNVQDHLITDFIWPCYHEIAEELSVSGSSLFKPKNQDTYIEAKDFISSQYDFFKRNSDRSIKVHPVFRDKYEILMKIF